MAGASGGWGDEAPGVLDRLLSGGADRRKWLTEKERKAQATLAYALGPNLMPAVNAAGSAIDMLNPVNGVSDAMLGGRRAAEADNWGDRMQGGVQAATGIAATMAPVVAGRIAGQGAGRMADSLVDSFTGFSPARAASPAPIAAVDKGRRNFMAGAGAAAVAPTLSRVAGSFAEAGAKPGSGDYYAEMIVDMLKRGKGDEVTDLMMSFADPRRLDELYDLPIDTRSRVSRALNQGFDTDNISIHTSKTGTNSFAPNNSAEVRDGVKTKTLLVSKAKGGGFDPTDYRGLNARFDPRLSHLKNFGAAGAGLGVMGILEMLMNQQGPDA